MLPAQAASLTHGPAPLGGRGLPPGPALAARKGPLSPALCVGSAWGSRRQEAGLFPRLPVGGAGRSSAARLSSEQALLVLPNSSRHGVTSLSVQARRGSEGPACAACQRATTPPGPRRRAGTAPAEASAPCYCRGRGPPHQQGSCPHRMGQSWLPQATCWPTPAPSPALSSHIPALSPRRHSDRRAA